MSAVSVHGKKSVNHLVKISFKLPRTDCLQCIERWGAGMVICLEKGADLHLAQLMPLPLTVSCSSKIHIGVTFLVPAHPGSPGQRAVKWVCVCVCIKNRSSKQVAYESFLIVRSTAKTGLLSELNLQYW